MKFVTVTILAATYFSVLQKYSPPLPPKKEFAPHVCSLRLPKWKI